MNNPWEEIDLKDYEAHMSLENVFQLQAMNRMMKAQFYAHRADSLMILGVAGGNGLEHIRKGDFKAVYGADINPHYLDACQKRYPELEGTLHPLCVDLLSDALQLPHADLIVANLLVEYIGYDCFQRVVTLIDPQYVSCVIQINTEDAFVSESPYLPVFDRLDEIHHQMEAAALTAAMKAIGYTQALTDEMPLPNGKKLVRIDFLK